MRTARGIKGILAKLVGPAKGTFWIEKLDILTHFGLEVEVTAAMTDNFVFAPGASTSHDHEICTWKTDCKPLR